MEAAQTPEAVAPPLPEFAKKATKVYLENTARPLKVAEEASVVAEAVVATKAKQGMLRLEVLTGAFTLTGESIWLDASRVTGLRSCTLPTLDEQEAMLAAWADKDKSGGPKLPGATRPSWPW